MAKGDSGPNGSTSQQAMAAPKMDQYSVMHSIMDRLGQGGGAMAGSLMPGGAGGDYNPGNPPMQIGGAPFGGGAGVIRPQFGGGGRMGGNFGPYGHDFTPMGQGSMSIAPQSMMQPSVAPVQPQSMMRQRMMGNNVS